MEEEATVCQIVTQALKSRYLGLVCIIHISHNVPPQNKLDEALMKEYLSSTFLNVTAQLSKCYGNYHTKCNSQPPSALLSTLADLQADG